MSHEIIRTRAGVPAMRSLETGEVMHPGVGPMAEAEQLYVRQSRLAQRLRAAESPALVLFDVGMGAASNALAALAESERAPAGASRLELVSFERELDALRTAFGEPAAFGLDGAWGDAARGLLSHGHHETGRSSWRLELGDALEAFARQRRAADIVYWDPFSPRTNPTLWSVAAFSALRRVAGPRCTLFTYSASTAVRVALLLAGWSVGVGAGTGEKLATTAAAVLVEDLERPLGRGWLARLSLPGVPLPPDAGNDAIRDVAAAPQFSEPEPRSRD